MICTVNYYKGCTLFTTLWVWK